MERNQNQKVSVGIYARLSVDRGIKKDSIASQIAIAKSYLAQQEEMELYDCYIDLGESGTHFKRNGFLRLMEDIRSGKVNCVVVKDFSRFGRNYLEAGTYIDKIFPFLGVRFISVADGFDSQNGEENEIDKNLKNLINEMYASDTAQKVKEVKRLSQKQGNYIGSRAPYGYRIEKTEGKRILVADKMTFKVVEKIMQLHQEGKSQGEIAAWLYQNRIHRPSDYRKTGHIYCMDGERLLEWQKGSIWRILRNPVYMQKEVEISAQKSCQMIQKEKNEQSVEKIQDREKKENRDRKGLLYCGDCNHLLSCRRNCKKKIYYCGQAKRMDILQCQKKQIAEEVIFFCIVKLVQLLFQKKENREELEKYCIRKAEECRKEQLVQLARIEMQIATQKRMISDSYMDYQIGKIGKEKFLARKTVEKKKMEYLQKRREEKAGKILEVERIVYKMTDWMEKIEKGEIDWLTETEFLFCIVKKIKLFCGNRIQIQFRVRR